MGTETAGMRTTATFAGYQIQSNRTMRNDSVQMDRTREALCHYALGLTGEAGEVADEIKKLVFYERPLADAERDKLVKELGDVLWYVSAIATTLDVTLEDVASRNVEKLEARYLEGVFTTQAANAQRDREVI